MGTKYSFWIIALVLASLCTRLAAEGLEDTFLQANIAYSNGNYAEAIEGYRTVLKSVSSAEVHYNLGNALAQQGDWSEAAFHYMKAHALNPSMEAAKANLLLATSRLGLSKDFPSLSSPARLLPEGRWTTVAAIAFWVALILFFHGDFVKFRIPLSKWLGGLSLIVLLVAIFAIIQHRIFRDWTVVSSPLASLRVAPTDLSPGGPTLIEGDPVRILGEQKGFFHVMTASGAEGFILRSEAYSPDN